MKNQGQFILSLRSKTASEHGYSVLVAGGSACKSALPHFSLRWAWTASPTSAASGLRQEQKD
jgi:hypothetical protein